MLSQNSEKPLPTETKNETKNRLEPLPNSANPFETIKDKWTINNKTNSFEKLVELEQMLVQNSAEPLDTKNENETK